MSDVGLGATLQLEISDALARIDQLGQKLAEATTGIPVVLDDPDASGVTQSIDQAVDASDSTVVADADAEGVTTGIDSAVQAADGTITADADAEGVTSSIDAAVGAADGTVPIDADTSSAEEALGALAAEADSISATVPVDADVSQAEAAIHDVAAEADGTEAEITVTADTTQADAAIGALGDTSEGTSGQVEGLTGSLENFKGATSSATGIAAGLGSSIGAMGPEAAGAVAAVGALVEITKGLFEAGVDATVAEQRLSLATGALREEVDKIHVGTLNTDLKGLAEQTGSTIVPIENAISRIFTLGKTSGESGHQIATTSSQILALAGNLRVTNPALGETGAIADTLTNALARGGRATQQFGISLTAAEIKQEALIETGKSSAAELTQYEKAAAGAKLATDRLGASFADNFAAGQNNPAIQLGQIKATFTELFEELGKPLVAPIIQILQDLVPVGEDVGKILGIVVQSVLPAATAFAQFASDVSPAIDATVAILGPVSKLAVALNPMVLAIRIADAVITHIVGPIESAAHALGDLASGPVGKVEDVLGGIASHFSGITDFAGKAVGSVGRFLGLGSDSADKFAESVVKVEGALSDADGQIRLTNEGVAELVKTSSGFSDHHQEDDLRRIGLSAGDVAKLALQGAAGLKQFRADAIKAGETKGNVDSLSKSFVELQKELDAASVDAIKAAAASGAISPAQEKAALAAKDHTAALQALQPAIDAQAAATDALTTRYAPLVAAATTGASALKAVNLESSAAGSALVGLANAGVNPTSSALVTFAIQMNNAALSSAGLDNAAAALGITTAQLTGFLQGVNGALTGFVNKVVSGLPTVADAFKPAETSARSAGGAMKSAGQSAADAQHQIEQAQHGILIANRGVEDSALALTKANEGVQKSVESLTSAQQDLAAAEQALADARQGPTPKDTEQASINLERAQIAAARATDAVTKAESDLGLARAGLGDISVADAEAALRDARLDSREAALRLQTAEEDLNTVRQTGTEADKNVVDAEKAVADAHAGVTDAQARVIDSQRQVVLAQRAVADSAYAAVQAEEALQKALNPPETGGGGGGGGVKKETVSLQEFVRNLEASTVKTKTFIDDIEKIFEAGGEQLSGEIAQLGVANGFTYAEQLAKSIGKDGKSALVTSAEQAVEAHNAELSKATEFLTSTFGPKYIATTGLIADLASKAFGSNLSFTQKLRIENLQASGELSAGGATIALIAGENGEAAAREYGKFFKLTPATIEEGLAVAREIGNMPLEGPAGDKGDAVAGSFGAPITDPSTGFGGSVQTGFDQVSGKFNANKGPLAGLGSSTGSGILTAFVTGINPMPGATQTALDGVGGALKGVPTGPLPGLGKDAGGDILTNFVEGLNPLPTKTGEKVAAAGPAITTAAKLVASIDATLSGGIVGASFTEGIAFGMNHNRDAQAAVDRAIVQLVNHIEAKAKAEADSHSPSKRFALFGRDITSGIAEGMSDADAVVAAAEEIVHQAAQSINDAIGATNLTKFTPFHLDATTTDVAPAITAVAARFTGAGFDPSSVQRAQVQPAELRVSVDMGGFTFTPDTTPEEVDAFTRAAVSSAVDAVRDKQAVLVALTMTGRG